MARLPRKPHREGAHLQVLDLRIELTSPKERGEKILAAVELLEECGVLELWMPSQPTALMGELTTRGHPLEAVPQTDGCWLLRVGRGALPPLDDLTELEAPEPLQRVLKAASELKPGHAYCARVRHRPVPLLGLLDARGARYQVAMRPDGTAVVWIGSDSP